ncbi:MAG: diphthine--ammonia ligase [Candidatus Poseidoniia archaeon]|jgi:ABC transporter with metal-binding/Fe-S-binding domain ATP-binding protein|nr:TIGR00289 family protein [Euryarchaeota archaeon]MDP6489520.1 diphthine--ammonia ligase [Candidatus Poseidoniia archaeon]MDP6533658.1 diphthine--ammonia ligase [Candidatus Poseidoniia archaeon]MDP6834807.1 diphthine--ammonia ligase [Candidatus Poseidoniia archaeon]HIH78778.1 diphthine--ammonia ligase [Candidatus Poseidoniia archaeon]|tara:strand:+ start:892 stop:1569 length:678 start_codon:yes stop_codon:yes gene_type:complete
MKLGVLFSGGKDSCLALHRAVAAGHEIVCLLTLFPERDDSWMFHTPALEWTALQAKALDIAQLTAATPGEPEDELADMEALLVRAQRKYRITGVVTGALASVYQATRVQRVCANLGLWCFNPLWQLPQLKLLDVLLTDGYEVVVTAVAADGLGAEWLGRSLDRAAVDRLLVQADRHRLNPAGEGGELETLVLGAPLFQKRLRLIETTSKFHAGAGRLHITEAVLV